MVVAEAGAVTAGQSGHKREPVVRLHQDQGQHNTNNTTATTLQHQVGRHLVSQAHLSLNLMIMTTSLT